MKKIIIASNNSHKIEEIKEILKEFPLEVKSLKEENINIEVEEDGKTFEENAKKKASEIVKLLNKRGDKEFLVLADDSGLEVDFLEGAPGIYSARYAGVHGDDAANNIKLLKEMEKAPKDNRGASFVCQLALMDNNDRYIGIKGTVRGKIVDSLSGNSGFGYDPLFFYEPFGKTFGEVSAEDKNRVSHRAVALKELKNRIKEFL